jgi:hypothetical protein
VLGSISLPLLRIALHFTSLSQGRESLRTTFK